MNDAFNWDIYHSSVGNSGIFTTAAINSRSAYGTVNNNVFTTKNTFTHNSTNNYIAYCWHSVPGYSAFGSYAGNSSADGPFVYTGFRPAWLMIKKTNGSATWWIVDSNRDAYNPTKKYLQANDPNAESAGSSDYITADFLSNGFKIRNTSTAFNSGDHIYMAFASQSINFNSAR